jgi:hypothetical protein
MNWLANRLDRSKMTRTGHPIVNFAAQRLRSDCDLTEVCPPGLRWKLNPIALTLPSAPNVERAAKEISVGFSVILVGAPAATAINLLQFTLLGSTGPTEPEHGFEFLPIFCSFGR